KAGCTDAQIRRACAHYREKEGAFRAGKRGMRRLGRHKEKNVSARDSPPRTVLHGAGENSVPRRRDHPRRKGTSLQTQERRSQTEAENYHSCDRVAKQP